MKIPALLLSGFPLSLCTRTTASAQVGTVRAERKISALEGGFGGALSPQDSFGWAVAALGDVDGNGVGDLAVGAPSDDDGGTSKGAVWILFLDADGSVASEQKSSALAGGLVGPLRFGENFGLALAALGDLDGNGVPDLPQPGFASSATAVEDPGFRADQVVTLAVHLGGSGAVDELCWRPMAPRLRHGPRAGGANGPAPGVRSR